MSIAPSTTQEAAAITIAGTEPMIIDPTDTKRRPALNADEARLLTSEIRHTTSRLWLLVTEAHDRAAHFALGYQTWDDYVRGELDMSPSRSYQLLDTGHVMRELASVGVDIDSIKVPPARVVARVKDKLPAVRQAGRKAVKDGSRPEEALRALAREVRKGTVPTTTPSTPGRPKGDGRRNARVTCPACSGEGKVSRSAAMKLRAFVRKSALK